MRGPAPGRWLMIGFVAVIAASWAALAASVWGPG